MKYNVSKVADENCNSTCDEVLFTTDDLTEASKIAANVDNTWGAAITDTQTGLVDFGFGFGVDVPEFEA